MKTLRDYAFTMIGLPYKWGGDDFIDGFDCSGLVIELLTSVGMLGRGFDTTAQGLYNRYEKTDTLEGPPFGVGDLVFFGKSRARISHVGFMLDSNRFIEAGGGGSKTQDREDAAQQNAFVRIRTLDWRTDKVAIVRPNYPDWLFTK